MIAGVPPDDFSEGAALGESVYNWAELKRGLRVLIERLKRTSRFSTFSGSTISEVSRAIGRFRRSQRAG